MKQTLSRPKSSFQDDMTDLNRLIMCAQFSNVRSGNLRTWETCKRGCKTLSCSCKKAKLPCIGLCACSNTTPDGGNICMNHSQTCTCSNSKLDALASWIPYTTQMFINGRLKKNWTGRVFWTKNITGCSIGYRVIVSWYSVCLWKEQFVFFFWSF